MKVLAELRQGVESETPYGGRAVSWEPLGWAWLKLGARRRREKSEPGGARVVETVPATEKAADTPPVETVTAETRSDLRLVEGRVLGFGGGDWRIISGETVGGRAILNLERIR